MRAFVAAGLLAAVYVAWTSFTPLGSTLLVSHSDDGALTWSSPVRADDLPSFPTFATLGVAADGTLYVGWDDYTTSTLRVDRSTDGGDHFGRDRAVRSYVLPRARRCSGEPIPAAPRRCVTPAPVLTVDTSTGPRRGRVYMTYAQRGRNKALNVFAATLTPELEPIFTARRVNPADGARKSDQFLPTSAFDASTGRLWACYYDTNADRTRKRAVFTCTASDDGGATWATPVLAASVASNETAASASPFGYGDYEGLAVAAGVAHPLWTDGRKLAAHGEEIYTAAIPDSAFAVR